MVDLPAATSGPSPPSAGPTEPKLAWLPAVALAVPPVIWISAGGNRVLGRPELDLVGHVWTLWNAGLGDPTRSQLVAFPHGADLMPILGGWLDIALGSLLLRMGLPLALSWTLICALWLALAGVGVTVLARVVGVRPGVAVVAGLLAQVDGYLLFHLLGGRTEQAGVGVMALAVAGAIHSWRTGSMRSAVATGIAGAAVVWTSWELGVALMGGMTVLSVGIWRGERATGAVRAWLVAAGTTLLLAGPLALAFLKRASTVRELDESHVAQAAALSESVGLVGWFATASTRPTLAVLGCLAVAAVLARRSADRSLKRAVGLLLLVTWLLAAGPSPGWWEPGDLGLSAGPWTLYQHLPVFGWFHSPERVLVWWSLAAPVAAAFVWSALGKGWLKRLGLATAFCLASLLQLRAAPWAVPAAWEPGSDSALHQLRNDPAPGAVLDLPIRSSAPDLVPYQLAQLAHQRPVPFHMTLPRLTRARPAALRDRLVLARWLDDPRGIAAPAPGLIHADLKALDAEGYAWITVWSAQLPAGTHREVVKVLVAGLGPPDAKGRDGWRAWRVKR